MDKNKRGYRGANVYINNRGQSIYYDRFRKCGYVITDESATKFNLYSNRYLFIALAVILSGNFLASWKVCIIVGIIAAVAAELAFRFHYLPSMTCIQNYTSDKKENVIARIVATDDQNKILIKILLFIALSILIVMNAYDQGYTGLPYYLSWAVCVGAAVGAVINLIAFFQALKGKKK